MSDVGDLLRFLDASPSPSHAVEAAVARLLPRDFVRIDRTTATIDDFRSTKGVLTHHGAVIAWSWPSTAGPDAGALFVGAHTDSPCLRLKTNPNSHAAGVALLEVEVYGGALLNSWLDRDLGAAGVVHGADGHRRLIDVRRPIARIPQLAIHLDRDVNDKGLLLNRQTHIRPMWSGGTGDILDVLGIRSGETFEVVLYDTTPAALVGANGDFIASGRLDNLASCWAAVDALRAHASGDAGGRPVVVCLFDHEEVGSESTTGAAGPLLEHVIHELLRARGLGDERFVFLGRSLCISADNAHALHPNYPERHDPNHAPIVNRGPALKFNANQRYATSAAGASAVRKAAAEANIALQTFVSNNTMPCGSTIGPITATRLGIETVDIGIPQLAMHSARETCGTADPTALRDLLLSVAASAVY